MANCRNIVKKHKSNIDVARKLAIALASLEGVESGIYKKDGVYEVDIAEEIKAKGYNVIEYFHP